MRYSYCSRHSDFFTLLLHKLDTKQTSGGHWLSAAFAKIGSGGLMSGCGMTWTNSILSSQYYIYVEVECTDESLTFVERWPFEGRYRIHFLDLSIYKMIWYDRNRVARQKKPSLAILPIRIDSTCWTSELMSGVLRVCRMRMTACRRVVWLAFCIVVLSTQDYIYNIAKRRTSCREGSWHTWSTLLMFICCDQK